MGRVKIKAVKTPVVAIINTGGELIPPGTKIQDNKIYNSNGPLLMSLLNQEGFSSRSLGIVIDRVPELKVAMKKGLGSDVLLISGGVSVGDYDFVPTVLEKLGVKKVFHKLQMKPGKPLYFGIKKRTLVFGIPGNPIPNFIVYWLFIHPALRKMTGYPESAPRFLIGTLTEDFKTKGDRQNFVLITIKMKNGQYQIQPVNSHGSADLQSLAQADGFMKLDIGQKIFKKNQEISFITWKTIA
jgi:molybdenum cofactor synthesis domain